MVICDRKELIGWLTTLDWGLIIIMKTLWRHSGGVFIGRSGINCPINEQLCKNFVQSSSDTYIWTRTLAVLATTSKHIHLAFAQRREFLSFLSEKLNRNRQTVYSPSSKACICWTLGKVLTSSRYFSRKTPHVSNKTCTYLISAQQYQGSFFLNP